ncbi:MAG: HAMP domain-containing sensor histidine kinase [Balneolaceae bacterium]|nr:HAMP domain-containing sensor histidine kinase [Balneolaceae bacterium]
MRKAKKIESSVQVSLESLRDQLEKLVARIEAGGGCIYLSTEKDVRVTSCGEIPESEPLKAFDDMVLFSGNPILGENRYIHPIPLDAQVIGYICLHMDSSLCTEGRRELIQAYAIIVAQELELVQNKSILERFSNRLLEKREELEKTQQYNSNLLSITTHDLSSPLNAVSGYLDLMNDALEEDGDLSRILDYHRMIQSGINDISDMLNQLNEIAKIEKGLVSLHFTKVDLCWLIEETCDLLRPLAQKENRHLHFKAPGRPVYAEVDFVKFKRVIYNLISNGIKYTDEGGRVVVRVEDEDERARVVVEDNGIGISEEKRQAIFEPFVKLNSSGKDGLTSSGLGLFISSYFTRQMHGDISVESEKGEGSTFFVTLPRAEGFQQSVPA